MSGFELYMLMKLDSLRGLSIGLLIAMTIPILISWLLFMVDELSQNQDEIFWKWWKKSWKKVATVFMTLILVVVFVPSTKQAIALVVAPAVINHEGVLEIPEKIVEIVNQRLDELMGKKKQ